MASATFVGRNGPDVMTFACLADGRYAILRNGSPVGVWGPTDLAYCLHVYLRMVDRPAKPVQNADGRTGGAVNPPARATLQRGSAARERVELREPSRGVAPREPLSQPDHDRRAVTGGGFAA